MQKLIKMLLSVVETVSSVTKPKHDMPEFIVGW